MAAKRSTLCRLTHPSAVADWRTLRRRKLKETDPKEKDPKEKEPKEKEPKETDAKEKEPKEKETKPDYEDDDETLVYTRCGSPCASDGNLNR